MLHKFCTFKCNKFTETQYRFRGVNARGIAKEGLKKWIFFSVELKKKFKYLKICQGKASFLGSLLYFFIYQHVLRFLQVPSIDSVFCNHNCLETSLNTFPSNNLVITVYQVTLPIFSLGFSWRVCVCVHRNTHPYTINIHIVSEYKLSSDVHLCLHVFP